MRLRFSDVKSACALVLNLNAADSRVLGYVNQACERLLYQGKWVGTWARYNVCISENCITWPREVETIEAVAFCNTPGVIRNGWYEFLEGGPGLASRSCGPGLTLIDRGNAVAFDDVTGTGKKLAIYADGTESAGTVLIRYYDSNGQKVYTTYLGSVIEGEHLTIPAAGNYTYSTYEVLPNGVYEVIKPVTNRVIRLYEYTVSGGALKPLAYYEPDEQVPTYRRSFIPALQGDSDCSSTSVTITCKLRFIPATGDTSILPIQHLGAVRLACQAVQKEEKNLINEAEAYWGKAEQVLNKQLQHWEGDGVVAPIRVVSAQNYDGIVGNLI